jgi:hypothetical protein
LAAQPFKTFNQERTELEHKDICSVKERFGVNLSRPVFPASRFFPPALNQKAASAFFIRNAEQKAPQYSVIFIEFSLLQWHLRNV